MKKHVLAPYCAELNLPGVKLETVDLSKGVPEPQPIRPAVTIKNSSTLDLHEELLKREGAEEIVVSPEGKVSIQVTDRDGEEGRVISGPCRILINHD